MELKKYILSVFIYSLCFFCLSSCTNKRDELFEKYILNPIPKSVRNIKIDQTKSVSGYGYLFVFDIHSEDLNLIISSKSLTKISNVEYHQGYLYLEYHHEDINSIGLPIYGNSKQARWFHPELWRNPDTYGYIKSNLDQNDFRILLFNKEENKAYFYIEKSRN